MKKFFPILQWLPTYKKEYLKGDLSAGLTVGVMLVPQGMAYSMLAGLPPIYGLYASTIPLIAYAIFGTSRQLSVGPSAMVALLVATGVSQLAEPGSDAFISLAILLALLVGIIQLSLGFFRLGFLVNLLSHPVISGFTSAAAVIIAVNQLKHLLGLNIPRNSQIHEILGDVIDHVGLINLPTLIIGITGMLIIILFKKYLKSVPGPLVTVLLGIAVVSWYKLDQAGVKVVAGVPQGLPGFSLPTLSPIELTSLLPAALTIAIIGFMESMAVAKAVQVKHKDYQLNANQEFIALGMSNILGSFFRSFPVVGGFSRTAVNDQSGARSGLASTISAILIILTLLFLTPFFYFLPQAILASIIMVAIFGLIDFKEALHLWTTDRTDFYMLMVTFLGTLAFGIEMGIAVGVILSLSMVIYRSAYPHIASLGLVPGTHYYRNVDRFQQVIQRPEVLVMRFDAPLFFANTSYFREHLEKLVRKKGDRLKLIVLNAEAISTLDSSAVHMLRALIEEYRNHGIEIYLAAVIGPVRDVLYKSGLIDLIGVDNLFLQVYDAVAHFDHADEQSDVPLRSVAVQTNIKNQRKGNLWD